MKQHSQIGHDILIRSHHPVFQMAAVVALYHHEKWDGSGYPNGVSGEQIPQSARIVAIADVFDALTMKRPYKEAWPVDKAVDLIRRDAGSHFDPLIVECFLDNLLEIIEIKRHWDSKEEHADGFDDRV